jgi:hypothetical protein
MATPKFGQLVQGQDYLTVVCANDACKSIIPIAPASRVYSPTPGHKITVGCPFCGASGDYEIEKAANRRLEILPPTAQ